MNLANDRTRVRRTFILIVSMGILFLLALANRKCDCHFLKMRVWDVLRTCDLLTLFVLSPLGIAIMWDYMGACAGNAKRWISMFFVLGVFLLGMGFGMHEPMLGMAVAGWENIPVVGHSIFFFKEMPGHWIFFLGMVMSILALAMAEMANPFGNEIPRWARALVVFAGLCGAVSLFGNMVNDQGTAFDMSVVVFCLASMIFVHWRQGFISLARLPMTLSLYVCFAVGSLATFGVWLARAVLSSN